MGSNQIVEVSPLVGLVSLVSVYLSSNQIVDVSALVDNEGLADGDSVWLGDNPLSDDAINVQIPALEARGVVVSH